MIFENCMLCVEMAKLIIFKVHMYSQENIFMRRQICVWTFLCNLLLWSFAKYFPKISPRLDDPAQPFLIKAPKHAGRWIL